MCGFSRCDEPLPGQSPWDNPVRIEEFVATRGLSTGGLNAGVLAGPWPWYVAGPLIGLFVPALLLLGNRQFGISSNLRHLCAAIAPARVEFFRYDWKSAGTWNLVFLAGVFVGGFLAARLLGTADVAITPETKAMLVRLGVHDFSGLAPAISSAGRVS